jgi:hypothetical protein
LLLGHLLVLPDTLPHALQARPDRLPDLRGQRNRLLLAGLRPSRPEEVPGLIGRRPCLRGDRLIEQLWEGLHEAQEGVGLLALQLSRRWAHDSPAYGRGHWGIIEPGLPSGFRRSTSHVLIRRVVGPCYEVRVALRNLPLTEGLEHAGLLHLKGRLPKGEGLERLVGLIQLGPSGCGDLGA